MVQTPQQIDLPNPDPIITSIYSKTNRDSRVRQFEEQVFMYKIDPNTVQSRKKYNTYIVHLTSDDPRTNYYVSLYDLALTWFELRTTFKGLLSDQGGTLDYHVSTNSNEALTYVLTASLVNPLKKPIHLTSPQLREALNII